MTDQSTAAGNPADLFAAMLQAPQQMFARLMPELGEADAAKVMPDLTQWASVAQRLQALWAEFQQYQAAAAAENIPQLFSDPGNFLGVFQGWLKALPLTDPESQQRMWNDSVALWENVLGQYGIGAKAGDTGESLPDLPRKDRRFSDPAWRSQPFYALVH